MKYFVTSKLSENIHETPEGFLLCLDVSIARTGEMLYGENETPLEADIDGKVIIDRSEEEVFSEETIASFQGKPITVTHPKEFVTPTNWASLAKGVLQNVRRGSGESASDLLADLLITDSMAIALVKNGLREVSCGYEAEYVQTEEGRGYQTKIIGNHLALVQKGRAGSSYAINDHKGDFKMKLSEKIKAIFAKAQDEAMKVATDEAGEKEEESKEKEKSKDAGAYDELVKIVKDLGEKISALQKPKDEKKADKEEPKKDDEKPAKDEEVNASLEERLKVLEAAVQKLLEKEAKEDEGEAEEEVGNEEEMEDDNLVETGMTGDAATEIISRAEILAPGIKPSKDVKAQALKTAYATKEGKKIIEALTGGKAPTFDSQEKVETLFIAASELMKAHRGNGLGKTKTGDYSPILENRDNVMTAEKMNEINNKFYKGV